MTYHIITIGCQMNKADSERIASYLELNDYKEVVDYKKASIIIINTCSVRQTAEDRIYGLVNQIRKGNKEAYLVITGCLANRIDVKRRIAKLVNLFLDINQLPNFSKLIDNKEDIKINRLKGEKYLKIPAKHSSSFSAYVPIGNGCNNFCSYCVVPYARGREVYRPKKEIISEVKKLIKNNYKEIILLAQNVNSYPNFPQLLKELSEIKSDFWLRFSSSHPKDLSDKLIEVIASSDKIVNHLHLALQSGDDEILEKMNRKYKAQDFVNIIDKIRKAKKEIAISTDIIVGFPLERERHFNNTKKLFNKLKLDMAYISQFSKRPQTAAFFLKDDVKKETKKRRELILNNILKKNAKANNLKYIGGEYKVLLRGKNKKGSFYGQTASNKNVIIDNHKNLKNLVGQFIQVRIKQADTFILRGELIK
jgi:tRNA-2-methylthio-N6-dimethylallyladenosine synthase